MVRGRDELQRAPRGVEMQSACLSSWLEEPWSVLNGGYGSCSPPEGWRADCSECKGWGRGRGRKEKGAKE